jgi:long-subunit fatty acid transport protein
VWGLSENIDYVSGRFGVDGTLRDDRSTWAGSVAYLRAPTLQNQITQRGNVFELVYTDTASASGTYRYQATERWSLGVLAGAINNQYSSVQGTSTSLQDNSAFYGGGTATYAYSERTQLNLVAAYGYTTSDLTRSDSITATVGFVHRFSEQLTVSASVGHFWSDITASRTALVCPTTPVLCDSGLVPRVPITSGESRSDNGQLYGGNISYAFSERTSFSAFLAENLAPSSTGTLTKTDTAGASLSHNWSERLSARLGASYTRQVFPSGLSGLSTTNLYGAEVGVSYLLAERWKLDAGYRYIRAEYTQQSLGNPQSNTVFVAIGYNWPGASSTDWVGVRLDTQGLPGAGPVQLSGSANAPSAPAPDTGGEEREAGEAGKTAPAPETSVFDQFTIP